MADLTRSAKAGKTWTFYDLESYHVSLNQVDPLVFFGLQELPQPSVDQELLSNIDARAMQHKDHAILIILLDLAMMASMGEAAVVDFIVQLFRLLGYDYRRRLARTRVDLTLFICGERKQATTDVGIFDYPQGDILLLVQVDKLEHGKPVTARAHLVAAAVAAFNENNISREAAGLPPLTERVMPGIVMVGTLPTFFKIPVTSTLSTHIHSGTYPPNETRVTYCYPPVSGTAHQRREGMKPLDKRREILKCYEAFKAIVGI